MLALLAGGVALVAALLVWKRGTDPQQAFTFSYYVAGVVVAGCGISLGTGTAVARGADGGRLGREQAVSSSLVCAVVGVCLIGIGVLFDAAT